MSNIGFGELMLILVLALVVFGPKKLPEVGAAIGRGIREFKKAMSDLQGETQKIVGSDAASDASRKESAPSSGAPAPEKPAQS